MTYTVRPLGCCSWTSGVRSLKQARLDQEEARDLGLANVVIVCDQTGAVVE